LRKASWLVSSIDLTMKMMRQIQRMTVNLSYNSSMRTFLYSQILKIKHSWLISSGISETSSRNLKEKSITVLILMLGSLTRKMSQHSAQYTILTSI
jgi:hypothetical protein